MKTIIAGSREIANEHFVMKIIDRIVAKVTVEISEL